MANEKRLIEANVLIRDLTAMKSVYDSITLDGMIKALREAPTIDAVEVVRCKDCKWWSFDYCTNRNGAGGLIFNGDWFCASGERKDNG